MMPYMMPYTFENTIAVLSRKENVQALMTCPAAELIANTQMATIQCAVM